ncbi:MAG TPA: NUDIX domain-containing protein [Streptosporangiaceae bacterium]|nr:NUDIX domain-containing protein [Streptosporangiaceae bacterium]
MILKGSFMPAEIVKHATASTFVFGRPDGSLDGAGPDGWRVGLITHPLFSRPMIPGGHVEMDETPEEAALREVTEETGLSVRLVPGLSEPMPPGLSVVVVAQPWWIVEHPLPSDNHLGEPHIHVDHIYVAVADDTEATSPAHPFAWYTAADLAGLDLFEDTRAIALELFSRIGDLAVRSTS